MNAPATSAQALREEFDRGFARAPAQPAAGLERLLAIQAGAPCLLRLSAVRAIHTDRALLPLPSRLPELLGVTGIRGQQVPVFDLAALLGHAPARAPRWLVLAAAGPAGATLGLAFAAFDAHVLAAPDQFLPAAAMQGGAGRHVEQAVQVDGGLRPLIGLAGLADELTRRAARQGSDLP
jgi:chemotaxis signal transduction protein